MKLKRYEKCKECPNCVQLMDGGHFYCNMQKMDPKNAELDITTCRVDPESKYEDCPWDKTSSVIESLNKEDQIGVRCMAKMFGGDKAADWFEKEPITNQEWLASLSAKDFHDQFMDTLCRLWFNGYSLIETRDKMIEWLDKEHDDI